MGAFFSAIGNFINEALNYTFQEIPKFFFPGVLKKSEPLEANLTLNQRDD